MQVKIKNITKDMQVTHVTLTHDWKDPRGEKLKMFFCLECQNPIAQYKGFVFSVMPGDTPVPLPVYIKCDHCKHLYSIQGIL